MEARRETGCRRRSRPRSRTRASRSEGASSRSLLDTAAAEAAVNVSATRPQEDALRQQQQRLRVGYKRRIHIWGALANIMHLDTVKSFIHEYALVQRSYDAGAVETINW